MAREADVPCLSRHPSPQGRHNIARLVSRANHAVLGWAAHLVTSNRTYGMVQRVVDSVNIYLWLVRAKKFLESRVQKKKIEGRVHKLKLESEGFSFHGAIANAAAWPYYCLIWSDGNNFK